MAGTFLVISLDYALSLHLQASEVFPGGQGLGDANLLSCAQHHLCPFLGCHLYAINTHHSRELRIVVAIRNKLLLITRKHSKPYGAPSTPLLSPLSESPVEEFQYIRVGFLCRSLLSWPRGREQTPSFHPESVPRFSSQLGTPSPGALVSPSGLLLHPTHSCPRGCIGVVLDTRMQQ